MSFKFNEVKQKNVDRFYVSFFTLDFADAQVKYSNYCFVNFVSFSVIILISEENIVVLYIESKLQ